MIYSGKSVVAEYHPFLILRDFRLYETKKALPKQSLHIFLKSHFVISKCIENYRWSYFHF